MLLVSVMMSKLTENIFGTKNVHTSDYKLDLNEIYSTECTNCHGIISL